MSLSCPPPPLTSREFFTATLDASSKQRRIAAPPPSFVLMKLLSVESTDSFPGGHSSEDPARFPRRAAAFSLTEAFVQATDRWQDTAGSSCP